MTKSRRRIPDTRASPSQSVRRTISLPPAGWHVSGEGLNCSESTGAGEVTGRVAGSPFFPVAGALPLPLPGPARRAGARGRGGRGAGRRRGRVAGERASHLVPGFIVPRIVNP